MRYAHLVFTVASLGSAPVSFSADTPALTTEQQEVVKVSEARMDAFNRRDLAAINRLQTDDFVEARAGGTVSVGKPREMSSPPESEQARDRRDVLVHVNGDTAIVTYLVTEVEPFGDSKLEDDFRLVETFHKRDGAWLAVAACWTVVEAKAKVNPRKAVEVDPRILKELVGQYEWRPGMVDTLTIEGGRLMQQMTGGTKEEVLFTDKDTMFLRSDLDWATVARDPQGRVTGYVNHRCDGRAFTAKKIR